MVKCSSAWEEYLVPSSFDPARLIDRFLTRLGIFYHCSVLRIGSLVYTKSFIFDHNQHLR